MTKGLYDAKVTWLTYLVYILLAFLTLITGWQQIMVTSLQGDIKILPDKYVRSDHYLADKQYFERSLGEIQKDIKEILRALK